MLHENAPQGPSANTITEENNDTQYYQVALELGDCYASLDKFDQAYKEYEKAASLSPDEASPYVGLGVVAIQQDMIDDAEIAFRVACRLDPNCAKAYAGLAMVAQQKKDYTLAFNTYLKCLDIDTDNMTALLGLFQVSCRMGSFEKIIHYLCTYLDSHPGDTSVMFSLAALYMKDGRVDNARSLLNDILALHPDHKEAANLLEELDHSAARAKLAEGAVL